MDTAASLGFYERHEFLLRRLHSLSGLIPVGAYMIVHLLTNSLTCWGVLPFQNAVYQIHSLGPALVFVEWGFIFLPIIFHAVFGVVIIWSGKSNVGSYPYPKNYRYTLQRISGMIALVFIFLHVFHLHGWFHFDAWLENVAKPLGGAQFAPYNATSTLGHAFQVSIWISVLYAIGLLACIFHLANGLWTMGITWGLWITPRAQQRANAICMGLGGFLVVVSAVVLYGVNTVDVDQAREIEDEVYVERVKDGTVLENEEKRAGGHDASSSETAAVLAVPHE